MAGDCWFSACTAYSTSERLDVRHVPLGLTAAYFGEAGRFGFVAGGGRVESLTEVIARRLVITGGFRRLSGRAPPSTLERAVAARVARPKSKPKAKANAKAKAAV